MLFLIQMARLYFDALETIKMQHIQVFLFIFSW